MNTIECPKCGEIIEIDTILEDQTKEKLKSEIEEKYKKPYLLQLKENRELKEKMSDFDIEVEKKLAKEIEKTRIDAKNKSDQEYQLKLAEEQKRNEDLIKQLDEAKRKGQQGSQQTQGEVLELQLEEALKTAFPDDNIQPVSKGVRGADIIQEVIDKNGASCGTIIWETKNAKWSNAWIQKLKDDQRAIKASISVLVSVDLPKEINNFGYLEGIWVTSPGLYLGVASFFRYNLIQVNHLKLISANKDDKKDDLYNYVSSHEFVQRVEVFVEFFNSLRSDIEKEKGYYQTKWANQEKRISKVLENTYSFYGDLKGIIGAQKLPELKILQIEAESTNLN